MVEHYIKELLHDFDYVCIAGLGAFVGNYKEAEISISKNKISPPSKQIVFNEKINTPDTLLIDYITKCENINSTDAKIKVEQYKQLVIEAIKTDKQYVIDGLGRLYSADGDKILFEQNLKHNFLKAAFGLPDLYFKPIDRTPKESQKIKNKQYTSMATNTYNSYDDEDEYDETNEFDTHEDEDEDASWEKQEKKTQNLAVYYILAVFALVLTAGTAYYLSMDKETYAIGSFSPLSWFGISPTAKSSSETDNKLLPEESENTYTQANESVEENDYTNDDDIPANPKLNKQTTQVPVTYGLDPADVVDARTGRYYIIAGGFRNKNKAAKYLSELIKAGNPAKVITPFDDKGVYRVSLSDYATYEEAKRQKEFLTNEHGDELWVLGY